jgi:uncharacterized protein (TIGR00106 family)
MALMEITLIPLGKGESVGEYIAGAEEYLRARDIRHSLHDMGTIIEGPVEELLQVANDLHNLPFAGGVQRVVTHITIDDRRDVDRELGKKTESVMVRLQERTP